MKILHEGKPQTNGDKIRAMNDAELAKRISERFCNGYGEQSWLDWLRSEATE